MPADDGIFIDMPNPWFMLVWILLMTIAVETHQTFTFTTRRTCLLTGHTRTQNLIATYFFLSDMADTIRFVASLSIEDGGKCECNIAPELIL